MPRIFLFDIEVMQMIVKVQMKHNDARQTPVERFDSLVLYVVPSSLPLLKLLSLRRQSC